MKTGKLLTCLLTMTTLATALPIHAAALIGDLNNDGVVDKQDAKILSEYFAGYPHDIDTVTADVNADGKLTRQDGMILNRYADGWDGYEIANVYYNENGDINIIDGVISTEIVESCDDAIVALENVKEKLEIDEPAEELVAAGSNSTEYLNSYTLQQTYEGIPVCGRSITVVTGKDGIADYVNSGYLKDISVSTEPTFSETEAWALINETYGESDENFYDGLQIFSLYEYETEPVLTHAFYVESTCEYVFVSAYDGSIVDTFSTCAPDSEPVNASGTDERGVNREFSVELRKGLFGNIKNYELSSDERNISVYHATDGLYESEDNNWEDTSAVSAYANVCVVYDWYAKEFNQNGFYDDGKIEVYVHSKETKDNAETVYRPKKEFDIITFFENGYKYGVGNPTTASSLDIVAHEFTHGVFFYKACGKKALGICSKGLLGAINEAYADTMSMIFNRNWIHGSDLTQNKSYMRNAIDPYENKCPKYYGDVYWTDPTNMDSDNGGVHDNSCVISHAAYLMYEKMSDLGVWNDDEIYSLLGDLWYNSMACGYNADSTFATVRLNVVKTAQKLGWNASDIKNIIEAAFDEVNVSSDPNEICDGFCEVLLDIKTTHENTNQKPNYCISLHNNGSISTFDLSDKTSLIVKKSVSTIEIYDSPNWSYFGVNTGYTTGEHRGYVIDLDLSDKTSIKLHDLRFAPLLELSCNYTFDNTTIDKITWKENGTAASDTTLILDDGCYFINIPRYLPDSTYDITLYNNGNVICELHDIEVKSKNTGGYYIELDDYISKYYSYRLTAHAIDSATGDGISNATIRLSFVDSTGTTTATSDPFTLSNIGIDMYFNTDSVYNTAIVSADGYTTKTIQLTEDNMITENTILHYSLGDVRLEKVVEETTHTVSGTVVDANGALAGVTVACSHGTTTTSNASGSYSFALPDGTYTLTFTLDGYETTTRTVTVNGSDCSVDVVTMATVVEEDIVASGECGADGNNVIWTLDETGILTLSGSGAIADYAYENWTDYLDSITSVNINEGITSIGNMSFSKLKKMTSISLPSTLTKIGGFAFSNCEILMSVTIPDSVTELGSYTFWNCLNLREIEIPSGIKTIPSHAFYECHALRKVTFNEGLTTIGFMAFAYCFCLDSISFPDSLTTIATQAFVNCSNLSHVEYPRNWTTVLEEKSQGNMSPFKDCYALNEIVIPDCVTQIPNGAFYSCKYLKTIVLPNGLTTIGNYAFSGTAIKAIDIPDSVTTIGVDAFSNTPLETVYIPKFVDDIGAFAFNNCNQLKSVYFYGNVPSRTPRDIFTGTDITIYYPEDAEGWTTPTYTFSFGITYNTEIFDSSVIFENTLSGKVTNSDNNPLLNAYILVYDSHKELVGSTSTDSEGVYTFTFTNKGVYYIYSESDGYVLNEPLVTAVNTNTLTLSTIVMETKSSVPTYEIVGYIVDAKTNAYLSAYGSIIGPGGSASFGSYESIGFYYSVSVPGTYEITIKQEGYEPYICLIDVNSPINSFVFELTPSDNLGNYCMFSGKVTDVNGESIEGASITVCNENTTDSVVATTNADGLFAGALTSVGTYSITISKEGYTISPDSYGTEYTEYTEGMNGIHLGTYILMTIPEIKIIASGECGMNGDNVTWTLDDSYALTVTGTGEMADYSYTSDNLAPWSSYRDQITSITIGEGITDTGEFTFYYCQNVTGEIAIPNGIETIGKCSFEGCKNVTYYNIPATVQQIDGFAFKDNTNLISFVIPDGVTCIGESAFEGCNSLTSIHFPDSLTTIEKHAFKNCYVLSSVTFPESLKCIGDYSFWSANGFTEIYIPANVNYIGIFAFSFSGSLEKITVSPENAYYCSDDYGVLFNKSMTQLYQYPKAKHRDSYIVPEGVTKITKYAFAQCAIKDVVLSSTVTVIESCAFWNCGVYTLTIPASVTRIGKNNLYCSYYITDVYFYGDVPANFEEGFNQGGNSALTLHYIEGKSGWTTPTWTAPDGKVYNTAVWNP